MGKLNIDGTEIQVLQIEEDDYISLTDMVRKIDNGDRLLLEAGLNRFIMSVKQWVSCTNLVFSGVREIYNNKI